MRVRPASLAAGLALAAAWSMPGFGTPDRTAAGRRPIEPRAVGRPAPVGSPAAGHAAAERQVMLLTRRFGAAMAALRSLPAAAAASLPVPSSPDEAAAAAASLRALADATALRLARLQEGVRQADALAAALRGERSGAPRPGDAGHARAGAIIGTPAADREERAAGRTATRASHQRSLKDAIAALAAAARADLPAGGGPVPGLASAAPVTGPLVQRYGQATDSGPAAGVSYAPPPAALVSSPCRGRVDFAGPFRSYGKMVIVDCGQGYRYVLAGLDRVDTTPGTAVGAGAPVGRMPAFAPGAGGRPTLYVQLRHGSDTVDPASRAPR